MKMENVHHVGIMQFGCHLQSCLASLIWSSTLTVTAISHRSVVQYLPLRLFFEQANKTMNASVGGESRS